MEKIKKRIEQADPIGILNEDLEYLRIDTTSEVFNLAVRYAMSICPQLGIKYDDFLYTMKVKESPYGRYWEDEAELWANANEEQRAVKQSLEPDLDIDKLERIIKENEERREKLSGLPVKLAMVLHVNGYHEDGKLGWEVTDLREIVRFALWGIKELDTKYDEHMLTIRCTEYHILTEIYFRVFLKPAKAYNNTFFFNLYIGLLRASVPLLNIMMPESLSLPKGKPINE